LTRAAPHGMPSSQNQSALPQLPYEIGRRSVPNAVGSKIAGFFGAVIGVVPLAIIAAALKQDWSLVGELVCCLVVTFGAVMFYHRSRCPRGEARGGATVLNPGSPARGFGALTITHYHDRRQ
jgi:hypothetical protein